MLEIAEMNQGPSSIFVQDWMDSKNRGDMYRLKLAYQNLTKFRKITKLGSKSE
jgi:hypothetical protein